MTCGNYSPRSPNRSGAAMADSKQVAGKRQQSLQFVSHVFLRLVLFVMLVTIYICFCVLLAFVVIFEIHVEVWSKGESIPNWNCMVLQLCIRSRAVESASEGHFVPFDSRQSPQPDSQWVLWMVLLVCRLTASEWKDRANEIMLQCCAPSC